MKKIVEAYKNAFEKLESHYSDLLSYTYHIYNNIFSIREKVK